MRSAPPRTTSVDPKIDESRLVSGQPGHVRKDEAGRIPRQDREENPRDGMERGAANWTAPSVNSELVRVPGPKANLDISFSGFGPETERDQSAQGLEGVPKGTIESSTDHAKSNSAEPMRGPCGQASRTPTVVPLS